MKMKKLMSALLGLTVMASVVAGCGGEKKQETAKPASQNFINIASGGTSGTYFPLGAAIADVLNKAIPGTNASNQSTGASVANVNLLKQGKVEIAFIQNDIAFYAANGTEMFKDKKVDNIRGIATLYPEIVQIITLEKSGIKSVADFKGKRIAVGAAGSGVEANARQIMTAYGVKYEDCKIQYLSFAEAASALKDGNVDAAFVTAGTPTAAVQELSTQNEVVLLPVDDEKADALIKEYPFYTKVSVPKGTYKIAEDTKALAVKCMLATTDKVDEKLGYEITKAVFGNLDRLKAAHKVAEMFSKAAAKDGMSIKLNAGAEKFLNEK